LSASDGADRELGADRARGEEEIGTGTGTGIGIGGSVKDGAGSDPVSSLSLAPARVLVLGLGNILLSDEGLGVHALQRFCARHAVPEGVAVLDGGTAGMDLIDAIAGHERLIVLDAVATAGAPGTRVRMADDEVHRFLRQRLSPHQLGLCDVLAYLELMDEAPRQVTILGVQPQCLDLGCTLSEEIERAMDPLLAMLADELARFGHPVTDAAQDAAQDAAGGAAVRPPPRDDRAPPSSG
jgi:hydrogenase maturation protease